MRFLPFIFANLFRKKIRTVLTVGSFAVALFLFGLLFVVRGAFTGGVDIAGADRLVTINRTSIIQPLPLSYRDRLLKIPGVKQVTFANWFGGVYQDERNFFPQFAVDTDTMHQMFPELVISDDQWRAFVADREGAVVGENTAKRFGWKIGDRIPIRGTFIPGIWEFNIRAIYHGTRPADDTTQFWFHWRYFDERKPFGKGAVGWYTIRIDNPDRAVEIIKTIDQEFANSPWETKTDTEKAFAASWVKQFGNIQFLILTIGGVVFFTLLLVTGNTMAIAVRERIGELAVLKAIGYSDGFVLRLVLAESLMVAAVGGALGMAIPVIYNMRSVKARWTSAVVAVLGIAGTVGVFVAMLSLARGFKATLVHSGSARNAMVRRAGSTSEMDSVIQLDQEKILEDAPGVARSADGPLVSPEVVVIAPFPMKSTGTYANVQIRGVSAKAPLVHEKVKIIAGRFFQPGLDELVVGKNAMHSYSGLELGNTVRFGGGQWKIVGVFDAGGTAFDSEVWCDSNILSQVYNRPANIFSSLAVRLTSPDALGAFKDALTSDPRLTLQAEREVDYYDKQSRVLTTLITVLGSIVAAVMGIGAVFGALNTMYSAVAERSREIATIRALGFGAASVVSSFVLEALLISSVGDALGCIAVLPLNGFTTGAMNWQTFSHLAFAFRVTPILLAGGIVFALAMGLVGGLPPAIRAARRPIAAALRAL